MYSFLTQEIELMLKPTKKPFENEDFNEDEVPFLDSAESRFEGPNARHLLHERTFLKSTKIVLIQWLLILVLIITLASRGLRLNDIQSAYPRFCNLYFDVIYMMPDS